MSVGRKGQCSEGEMAGTRVKSGFRETIRRERLGLRGTVVYKVETSVVERQV